MCTILTPLVQHSVHRQMARCEHGTLHLSWHAVTWSLSGRDFVRLHAFVRDAVQSGQSRFEAPPMVFGRSDDGPGGGNVTLWFGPAGLAFAAEDFEAFCKLLSEAQCQLERYPAGLYGPWQTQFGDLN